MPSDSEVELATGAVGGRRREGDGGYMNVREHVMMMIVVIVMMVMVHVVMIVLVGVVPGRIGTRLGYVKAQKRLQSAARPTDRNVVADGGGGG